MAGNTNSTLKYGIALGVGIALGALGVILLKSNKKTLRTVAAGVIGRGFDLKEKALTMVEEAKEAVSDLLAEAAAKHKERREKD
ncbi:MAG: hypothetical protein LBJ14_08685 [Desulfarculales bacterium]|jgi:hypothetical protein|nr:hypothetical protein [Desulfarculales bacterium]